MLNFIDQIKILEEMKEVTFENVAYPILFLPFVSRSSEIIGKKIKFLMDDNQFLLNYNQSLYSNYLSEKILENVKLIKIQFLDNANTFDENEWNEIYKLSENTFVEENEKLKKSAAGAGLTDND